MRSFFKNEKRDTEEIFRRLRKRDFSGDAGLAVKNSTFQLITNLIVKIGSLVFMIILTKMLIPEQYGLYYLALSTIIIFYSFTDLGISSALITFLPKEFRKKNYKKAKAYIAQLIRWRLFLIFIVSLLLIVVGYFLSNFYYQKPIFLALFAGVLYILFSGLMSFYEGIYKANNDFKTPLKKEVLFQIIRILFVPLIILILIKLSHQILVSAIIISLSLSYLIALFYLFKNIRKVYPKTEEIPLTKKEKSGLIKFILPLSSLVFSGIFFGYIDTIMLGRYVLAEFISYYGVAFSLVSSATALISFSSSSFFPLFASSKGKRLEKFFRKAKSFTITISLIGVLATFFLADLVIKHLFAEYAPAILILKIFSILVLLIPLSSIYDSYLISQKKTKALALMVIIATVLNVILNLIGINFGLTNYVFFGVESPGMGALIGVSIATILSKLSYLVSLALYKGYLLRNKF